MSTPLTYPAAGYTNPNTLFLSLGQFWTRIFGDREMLHGLSIGQAEQLIQRYQDFVESVRAMSATDMPELHIENWLPIRFRLSQVQVDPYLFLPEASAHLFNDSPSDHLFGLPFPPAAARYVVELGTPPLLSAPLICNRVVAPSMTWISGQNYGVVNNQLWMTTNPFDEPDTMKYNVLGDDGAPETFDRVLEGGTTETVQEEEMILWVYRAKLDTDIPYTSFGYIFDYKEADPEICRLVLEKTTSMFTNGPVIQPLLDVVQAFAGVESVKTEGEVVVDAYELEDKKWVITDKNVYKAPLFYNYTSRVVSDSDQPLVGNILHVGDLLFDVVEYYDAQTSADWWNSEAIDGVTLPPHVFSAGLSGTLYFPNDADVFSSEVLLTSPTRINLAGTGLVLGQAEDIAAYEAYLNDPARLTTMWDALDAYAVAHSDNISFLDFLFLNLLRTNTALLKLKFATRDQAVKFLKFYKVIQKTFPKNVYLVVYFAFDVATESVSFVTRSLTNDIPFAGDGADEWGRLVTTPLTMANPVTLAFGEATTDSPATRQFVMGKAIDLYTGTTTVYATEDNLAAGTENGNLARVYKQEGTLSTATIEPTAGVFKAEVTGVGTFFMKDFSIGAYLVHPVTGEKTVVESITSNTVMTLATVLSVNISAGSDVLLSRVKTPSMRFNTRRLTLLGNL